MAYNVFRFFASIALLLASLTSQAETVQWQGYDIHYTTFSSLLIPQEVASAHNIVRSKSRIVTNISIRKDDQPVRANLDGNNTNLLNQLFTMDFDEVIEDSAIYYLSNQVIDEKDHLRFNINISPDGHSETYELKFTRQY